MMNKIKAIHKHMHSIVRLQVLIVSLLLLISACKKDSGTGGSSTIKGYIHVTKYNTAFTSVLGNYAAGNQWVYIIYGDNISYGDRTLSLPDGTFAFNHLRKGNYTLYVYSEDASLAGLHAVSKTVEITESQQTIDAGTFKIDKD